MDQEWKKVTETVLCWMNVLQNTERKIYEIRVCTQQEKSEMERYSIISCRSVSICSPLFNFTSSYHLCTSCFLEYLDNTQTHRNWNTTQSHTWQVCAVSNLDLADLSAPTLIYWNVCACVCVCVISGNINCCSSETVCACMCVGVSELVPIKEETVRSCWVTMATGWAAMTGFC